MNSSNTNPFPKDKSFLLEEVTKRVLQAERERCKSGNAGENLSCEILLNEAATLERERLKREKPSGSVKDQLRFWSKIHREFQTASEPEREKILVRVIRRYAEEIHSEFDPSIHGLATRVLPWLVKLIFNRVTTSRLMAWGNRLNLGENLIITGPVGTIRKLSERSTLILAPTHVSNLDSIVLGLGLHRLRLPPFRYGAGLNLYSNPVIAYFLNNLGAYKVDRTKKNSIYKDTLKEYAALSLESGEHNLFFPGGTRNRRGDVEQHIKLGLLGCGLSAYFANVRNGAPKPDVFIVPATLSYGLVLEAKTLIDNHLRSEGKTRYIHERSPFSKPIRIFRFWRNLQSLNSRIHLHLCEPVDLFGHAVDAEGVSRDARGLAVDRLKYLEVGGVPSPSAQRDQEYVRELGNALVDSYRRNNTALSTHVVAFAAFAALQRLHPEKDFYRFLRDAGPKHALPLNQLLGDLETLLTKLRDLEKQGGVRLEEELHFQKAAGVFQTAMTHFNSYHDGEVLMEAGGRVWSQNLKLLYYYRNRLDHYDLDHL